VSWRGSAQADTDNAPVDSADKSANTQIRRIAVLVTPVTQSSLFRAADNRDSGARSRSNYARKPRLFGKQIARRKNSHIVHQVTVDIA
jgi:hypothetical protein